jgi:hypothetical protein
MTLTVSTGIAQRPAEGMSRSGDAAVCERRGAVHLLVVVDVLGHGPSAADTAAELVSVIQQHAEAALVELFHTCNAALIGKRGAVMSAIRVSPQGVWFAGLGNVELLVGPNKGRPHCVPGTLGVRGHKPLKLREAQLPTAPGDRYVLASDGMREREMAKELPQLRGLNANDTASALLAHASRPEDDATVLVIDFS